nr:calcium-dependent secretion activator-like [Parasteatoda tepidariorum]
MENKIFFAGSVYFCNVQLQRKEIGTYRNDAGYTVDYVEPVLDLKGGRFFFNVVEEGDSVLYASGYENECHLWIMVMYRTIS